MDAANRIEPNFPVHAYKTYRISSPLATHFRDGTCAEAECGPYLNGWQSLIDESTELGQRQAYFIRHDRDRRHTESRTEAGLTVFTFEAGQECFAGPHKVPVGRPELYVVRDGDWRGNPTGERRVHANAADWIEDFGEHQDRLADQQRQG